MIQGINIHPLKQIKDDRYVMHMTEMILILKILVKFIFQQLIKTILKHGTYIKKTHQLCCIHEKLNRVV